MTQSPNISKCKTSLKTRNNWPPALITITRIIFKKNHWKKTWSVSEQDNTMLHLTIFYTSLILMRKITFRKSPYCWSISYICDALKFKFKADDSSLGIGVENRTLWITAGRNCNWHYLSERPFSGIFKTWKLSDAAV